MSNSSEEQLFTITLNDNRHSISEDLTVTWDTASIPTLTSNDVINITGSTLGSGSFTTSTIDLSAIETFSSFTNLYTEEFDGRFPDFERIQQMCKEYPGLDIAYRKFKEVYSMVKEDFDGKERERRDKY